MIIDDCIEKVLSKKNGYIHGYADLADAGIDGIGDFSFALSIAKRLDDGIIDAVADGPTPEYYRHYREVNAEIAADMQKLSDLFSQNGIIHQVVKPTTDDSDNDESYQKEIRYWFQHKTAATRAALGWIGRTGLLVTKKYGPRVRLATILLDYPLQITQSPVDESSCGSCMQCVESCPAHAATGASWKKGMSRDELFDAFKCREKCRALTLSRVGVHESICGICVSVCPHGRRKQKSGD
jgi:epoxyqueuosine reductase QueG